MSIFVELNEDLTDEWKLVAALRLWKLIVFMFDVALVQHEVHELREKSE